MRKTLQIWKICSNFAAKICCVMKKFTFILLFVAAIVGMNSCTYNEPCRFNKNTVDIPVKWSDWKFDNEQLQFYVRVPVNTITEEVYKFGNFSMYHQYYKDTKDAYMVAMPQSMFMTDTLDTGDVAYYTQYLDYRTGIGYVEIQVTNSDYFYPTDAQGHLYAPDDMDFRLEIIY